MNTRSAFNDSLAPSNKLHHDVEIEGTLTFDGTLEFQGTLKGNVAASGTLIVGEKGRISGNIKTGSLVVFGSIEGNAEVANNCILKSSCGMKGDLTTSVISMEEGASYTGKLIVTR